MSQTPDIGRTINAKLSEFFCGYVFVGYVAGTQHEVVLAHVPDPMTRAALQQKLEEVLFDLEGPDPDKDNE